MSAILSTSYGPFLVLIAVVAAVGVLHSAYGFVVELREAIGRMRGRNTSATPPAVISAQLTEPRPLPMGVKEFHEWSDRIISGAMIPGATARDQKFALAGMVMHTKPTESFVADGYFIQSLRKVAANQVCHAMILQYKAEQQAEASKAFDASQATAQ